MNSRKAGDSERRLPAAEASNLQTSEDLILWLNRREAELNLRELAVVSRENQLRIDTAQQRDLLALAASRVGLTGYKSFEETFKDFPLGISLALTDILQSAKTQARSELHQEFAELAKAQSLLAASASQVAAPLVHAVTLRADHLERLLDESLIRNRELAARLEPQRSDADLSRLASSIAERTAQLISAREGGPAT